MMEDYTAFSRLTELPTLVRRQRMLEAAIAPLTPLVEDEKTVRQQIDALLLQAGIAPGDGVTCLGYDVIHHERVGQSRINGERLAIQLRARGLDPETVATVIAMSTEVGEPASWASVKPGKGSTVRAPKPVPAKATLRDRTGTRS
jgi:hypothetical protein